MPITLPNLPYDKKALEPHISAETLDFHHGKHHNAYVVNGNKLIAGTEYDNMAIEDIIKATAGKSDKAGIFNNIAQVWNHTFYWNSMKPNGGGKPSGNIAKQIDADFGSFEKFKEEFVNAGATQFGSGWAWLVFNGNKLSVTKTPNAATPITDNLHPIITMDVWEHAYYIDYRNARPTYMEVFLNHLVNWDFAEQNLINAKNSSL